MLHDSCEWINKGDALYHFFYLLFQSSFQVCKSVLYAAFDVDDTDTECDSNISESDNSEVESQTEVSAVA